MQAEITISLKNGVLDPEAKAIQNAIHALGFSHISQVAIKKQILLECPPSYDAKTLQSDIHSIASTLLANPVIEDYNIRIKD